MQTPLDSDSGGDIAERRKNPAKGSDAGGRLPVSAQDSGKGIASAVASPFADLSTTLVEKSGLLPIGYFEATALGVVRPCMGAYVGQGRFVTAAHCLAGLEDGGCPVSVRFRWLRFDQGSWSLGADSTACEAVRKSSGGDASGSDIAVVRLAVLGTWPAEGLSFETPESHVSKLTWMVGPQGMGDVVALRTRSGRFYELRPNYFLFSAAPTPGFSGTPVFLAPESGPPSLTLESRILGLYMGASDGAARVFRSERVAAFLAQ